MDINLSCPPTFGTIDGGNIAERWTQWIDTLEMYFTAAAIKNGSPLLIKHFTKTHSVSDLIIKPIRTVLGTIDEAKESELHWIKELGTLYPYGLNDRLDKPYIDAHKYYLKGSCVFSLFNRRKSRRGSRGKGSHHTDGTNTPQKVEIEEIYRSFLRAFVYDNEYRFFIRVKINGLPKAVVRQLIQYCILKSKKRNSNVCLLNTTILDICRNYWVKSVPKSYNEDDKKSDYFVCSFMYFFKFIILRKCDIFGFYLKVFFMCTINRKSYDFSRQFYLELICSPGFFKKLKLAIFICTTVQDVQMSVFKGVSYKYGRQP